MTDSQPAPPYWQERWDSRNLPDLVDRAFAAIATLSGALDASEVVVKGLLEVASRVRSAISSADAQFVSEARIDRMATVLGAWVVLLEKSATDGSGTTVFHLQTTQLDSLLDEMSVWQLPDLNSAVADESAHIGELQGRISGLQKLLFDEQETRLGVIKSKLDEDAETLGLTITSLETKLDSLASSATTLEQRIADGEQRMNDQLTSQNEAFNKVQTERAETFSKEISDREGEFKQQHLQVVTNAADLIKELQNYRDEARELVQITAETSMAGGYQKEAQEERTLADRWREYALWNAWAGVALVVGAGIWNLNDHNSSWNITDGRYLLSVVIFGVAGYCAKQSAGHRIAGNQARKRELQFAAIGPYLHGLQANQEDAVRIALAMIWFGDSDDGSELQPDDGSISPLDHAKGLLSKRRSGGTK